MSSTELHQVVFKWPHTEPTTVIVTGTFDEWKSSICLAKNNTGFEGAIQIPWGQTIKFKFIVDGEWLVHEDRPTEVDPGGFINNIYTAPPKPVNLSTLETTPLSIESEKPTAIETNNHRTNGDNLIAEVAEKPEDMLQSLPKEHAKSLTSTTDGNITGVKQKTSDTQTSVLPQLLSDLASTIAARDGTSSALAYVASGLGAAMHNAVGIDPINIPKIAIPTPKYNEDFTLPPGMGITSPTTMEEGAPGLSSSPIAPLVPIMIVPVNAAENNTIASSPTLESMHILPRFAVEPSVSDINYVPDAEVVTEKIAADRDMVVDAVPAPQVTIKKSAIAETEVTSVSDVALADELETPEKQANGPSGDPAVVHTFLVPEPIVEESTATDADVTIIPSKLEVTTERMTGSSSPPVNDIFSTPEPVIKGSATAGAEAIPVEPGAQTENFPETSTRQLSDEASSTAVHGSQGQYEELEVSTSILITKKPDLDATSALVTGSGDTVLVPSNEAIISLIPVPTSVEEVKPEEDLSPVPEESSDKITAFIKTVVEPIPVPIIGSPVDVAESETKSLFEGRSEDSALEPTEAEADPVFEEPPAKPIAAEDFVERTPIPVIEVPVDTVALPVVEDCPAFSEPSVEVLNDNLVNFETATISATAAAEPIPTYSVTPTVTELPASSDQTSCSPAALQTTEDSVPGTNGHFTPTAPDTPHKETPTTGLLKGIQEFPSLQSDLPSRTPDSSPLSSKFNSVRKKKTSIFGKIKNIFHHDKDKEKK